VYLELGGKSPNIIFDDVADIDAACKAAIGAIFRNSGQTCVAGSRLLVHARIKEQVVESLVAQAEALRIGDPLDPTNDVGAVHSQAQLLRNLDHVAAAKAQGGKLVTGGHSLHDAGYYMAPTIFDDVAPTDAIFQEEIFGPVLTVTAFDDVTVPMGGVKQSGYGYDRSLRALDQITHMKTAWMAISPA